MAHNGPHSAPQSLLAAFPHPHPPSSLPSLAAPSLSPASHSPAATTWSTDYTVPTLALGLATLTLATGSALAWRQQRARADRARRKAKLANAVIQHQRERDALAIAKHALPGHANDANVHLNSNDAGASGSRSSLFETVYSRLRGLTHHRSSSPASYTAPDDGPGYVEEDPGLASALSPPTQQRARSLSVSRLQPPSQTGDASAPMSPFGKRAKDRRKRGGSAQPQSASAGSTAVGSDASTSTPTPKRSGRKAQRVERGSAAASTSLGTSASRSRSVGYGEGAEDEGDREAEERTPRQKDGSGTADAGTEEGEQEEYFEAVDVVDDEEGLHPVRLAVDVDINVPVNSDSGLDLLAIKDEEESPPSDTTLSPSRILSLPSSTSMPRQTVVAATPERALNNAESEDAASHIPLTGSISLPTIVQPAPLPFALASQLSDLGMGVSSSVSNAAVSSSTSNTSTSASSPSANNSTSVSTASSIASTTNSTPASHASSSNGDTGSTRAKLASVRGALDASKTREARFAAECELLRWRWTEDARVWRGREVEMQRQIQTLALQMQHLYTHLTSSGLGQQGHPGVFSGTGTPMSPLSPAGVPIPMFSPMPMPMMSPFGYNPQPPSPFSPPPSAFPPGGYGPQAYSQQKGQQQGQHPNLRSHASMSALPQSTSAGSATSSSVGANDHANNGDGSASTSANATATGARMLYSTPPPMHMPIPPAAAGNGTFGPYSPQTLSFPLGVPSLAFPGMAPSPLPPQGTTATPPAHPLLHTHALTVAGQMAYPTLAQLTQLSLQGLGTIPNSTARGSGRRNASAHSTSVGRNSGRAAKTHGNGNAVGNSDRSRDLAQNPALFFPSPSPSTASSASESDRGDLDAESSDDVDFVLENDADRKRKSEVIAEVGAPSGSETLLSDTIGADDGKDGEVEEEDDEPEFSEDVMAAILRRPESMRRFSSTKRVAARGKSGSTSQSQSQSRSPTASSVSPPRSAADIFDMGFFNLNVGAGAGSGAGGDTLKAHARERGRELARGMGRWADEVEVGGALDGIPPFAIAISGPQEEHNGDDFAEWERGDDGEVDTFSEGAELVFPSLADPPPSRSLKAKLAGAVARGPGSEVDRDGEGQGIHATS